MAATLRVEPGWWQEPGTLSGSPTGHISRELDRTPMALQERMSALQAVA